MLESRRSGNGNRSRRVNVFNSVGDIFDFIDKARADIYARVEGLTDQQQRFRPAEGAWSVAELAEHLSITEGRLIRVFGRLIDEAEAGARATGGFTPFSLDVFTPQL